MDSIKMGKSMTWEDEPCKSEAVQYATGEEWRAITNSSRKNEVGWAKAETTFSCGCV